MRTILGFSWAVFVIQVCTLVIYQQTDRLVLGVFLGAAAITLYEAAGKFLGLVDSGGHLHELGSAPHGVEPRCRRANRRAGGPTSTEARATWWHS